MSTVGFLSTDLTGAATVVKSGFTVTLAAGTGAAAQGTDCNGTAGQSAYYTTAMPVTFGTSGNRSFGSNTVGTIFFANSATAPTEAQMAAGGGGTALQ